MDETGLNTVIAMVPSKKADIFSKWMKNMETSLDEKSKKKLSKCIDWSKIDKTEYLDAMSGSVVTSNKLFELLKNALTSEINDREIIMKGIDYSYYYETEE